MIQTTTACLLGLLTYAAFLICTVIDYKCEPYTPKDECKLGKFEIHIRDITQRGAPIMAVAEGECVYVIGSGKSKRYAMREATFTAANRTDYFERGVEIPAVQAVVCEIK